LVVTVSISLSIPAEQLHSSLRGIVKHVGNAPKHYLREAYSHIDDLRVGDEVLFDPRTPLFYLERNKSLARFDGDNQYWVVMRRRIIAILNR